MTTTNNSYCVPGRFWSTIPARERTEGEIEILRELLCLEAAEAEEEAEGEPE